MPYVLRSSLLFQCILTVQLIADTKDCPVLETGLDQQNNKWYREDIHGIIQNRFSRLSDVAKAAESLKKTDEPADFWVSVMNDEKNYTKEHRTICIEYFFRRHVRSGMALKAVSKHLAGANWLDVEKVRSFNFVIGSLGGLKGDPQIDSVFSIRTWNEGKTAIYVSIKDSRIEKARFVKMLRGAQDTADELRILDLIVIRR